MEHKSSREKAWVASKNRKTNVIVNDGSNNEINNLQDDSFVELEELEEEPVPLTEEEKLEIRKKIGILLIFVFVAFLIMIVILVLDPFAPKNKNANQEEKKEKVVEKVKDLKDYDDGEIDLTNGYIKNIYSEISFNSYDNYELDTYFLFLKDVTNINTLTDLEKTILVSKTLDFNYLVASVSKSENICEETISISTEDMSKIALNKYGTVIKPVTSFKYNYYYDSSYITSINFTLDNDKYIGKCYTRNTKATKFIDQELVKATKKQDNLYLDVKVVFIIEKGVFKDPNHKTLITNNKESGREDYIKKGNTYRFSYVITEDGYYLDRVTLLK